MRTQQCRVATSKIQGPVVETEEGNDPNVANEGWSSPYSNLVADAQNLVEFADRIQAGITLGVHPQLRRRISRSYTRILPRPGTGIRKPETRSPKPHEISPTDRPKNGYVVQCRMDKI